MSNQPTRQQVHAVDVPLTNITIAAMQSASDFVASQVLPSIKSQKSTGRYYKYDSSNFNRDAAQRRAAGTESAGTGFTLSDDSYLCEKYALHVDFDFDTLDEADDALQLEDAAAELLATSMLIRKEKMFADACWATTAWTNAIAGNASTQWDQYTTSDPIVAIDTAKAAVRRKIFRDPNTLIVGEDVFLKLKEHPDLTGRVQYTSSEILNEQAIARLLGVEKIFVAKALENSASEGLTDSLGAIINAKHALLCYIPPNKNLGLMSLSAFAAFNWDSPRHPNGVAARRFDLGEAIQAKRIEVEIATDIKVLSADAGYFFASIVA